MVLKWVWGTTRVLNFSPQLKKKTVSERLLETLLDWMDGPKVLKWPLKWKDWLLLSIIYSQT